MVECYVDFIGKIPGIYPTWPAAAAQVIGYSGAVHMRYPTIEAGVAAWDAYFNPVPLDAEPTEQVEHEAYSDAEKKPDGSENEAEDRKEGIVVGKGSDNIPQGVQLEVGSCSQVAETPRSSCCHSSSGDGSGSGVPSVMGANEALEGRVSQLEMDKWELLLQLAQLVEQIDLVLPPEFKD